MINFEVYVIDTLDLCLCARQIDLSLVLFVYTTCTTYV